MMRIAVAGLHMECSSYNPVLAGFADFRQLRGADLLAHPYFAFLQDVPAEFIPLLHARAIAGGPIAREVYGSFKQEILEGLKTARALDGLYLAMHGAMQVENLFDAEGDFISSLRAVVGPDLPISVSYDLHGNLSATIIRQITSFSTYRTAPHIDVEATMRRAVSHLMRILTTGERPHLIWQPVPVLLPGEKTSTTVEPAASFYASLAELDQLPGIWEAGFQVGYVWADEPRATAASIITGTDLEKMRELAQGLAQRYWDLRHDFQFDMATAASEETITRALTSPTHPVIIADSGDNPTGGGVGDRAELLTLLLHAGAQDTLVAGIADAEVVALAFAHGLGKIISGRIGGTLDPSSKPLPFTAEVKFLSSRQEDNPTAVVQIAGITLIVTQKRCPFHHLADFTALGLELSHYKIILVKSGYLSPELAPLANPALMALSAGAVNQDIEKLPRHHKTKQQFPFDQSFTWQPDGEKHAS